jgi:predicted small metal-binding protein
MKGNMKDMGMKNDVWDMKNMKCMMCEDGHGFMVKSNDEKEVMEMGRMHLKEKHKMNPTDKDIKESMKACKMEMEKW